MISPIDLIPDPVLIFGIIDDIVIWACDHFLSQG